MDISIVAIIVAALSSFIVGGIWYGPLFEKLWKKENGFTDQDLNQRNMGAVFGLSFLFALISAFVLEMFIGRTADFGFTMAASLSVGFAWVATSFGTTYLFEKKSLALFIVNAGYHVFSFGVMGFVLAVIN